MTHKSQSIPKSCLVYLVTNVAILTEQFSCLWKDFIKRSISFKYLKFSQNIKFYQNNYGKYGVLILGLVGNLGGNKLLIDIKYKSHILVFA